MRKDRRNTEIRESKLQKGDKMKSIPLTQGKIAVVSDKDYPWLSKFKWRAHKDNRSGRWYAARSERRQDGRVTVKLMHREIRRPRIGLEVDHRNKDGLNNCRSNLRECTHKQNSFNSGVYRIKKSSKYKGVIWNKSSRKWLVYLQRKHLGAFTDEVQAAREYDKEAKKQFGKFAHLNFPKCNQDTGKAGNAPKLRPALRESSGQLVLRQRQEPAHPRWPGRNYNRQKEIRNT